MGVREISHRTARAASSLVAIRSRWTDTTRRQRLIAGIGGPTDCYLCGEPLEEDTAVVDHVHPESLGGDDSIENLRWACRECNQIKGQLPLHELIQFAQRLLGRFPLG